MKRRRKPKRKPFLTEKDRIRMNKSLQRMGLSGKPRNPFGTYFEITEEKDHR
jgi:hypothetical protein